MVQWCFVCARLQPERTKIGLDETIEALSLVRLAMSDVGVGGLCVVNTCSHAYPEQSHAHFAGNASSYGYPHRHRIFDTDPFTDCRPGFSYPHRHDIALLYRWRPRL